MNIKNENLQIIPYTATSISLIGRFFLCFYYTKMKAQIIYLYFFPF